MSEASNPFEPRFSGFAGFGSMMEQMESFKRLWSSMDVSNRLVPTLDIEELDKRIADLKAVEQWLNLNLGMLKGTIQGLEIQRGTLAAVQAFGASFAVPKAPQTTARESVTPAAAQASSPAAQPAGPRAGATPETPAAGAAGAAKAAAAPQSPMPGGIDPSAWWNLLQTNFQQIAQAALAGTQTASQAAPASASARQTAPASGASKRSRPAAGAPGAAPPANAGKRPSSRAAPAGTGRASTRKPSGGR